MIQASWAIKTGIEHWPERTLSAITSTVNCYESPQILHYMANGPLKFQGYLSSNRVSSLWALRSQE